MGNGLSNIIAAAIVALAIVWTGGFSTNRGGPSDDERYAQWIARAVGDIQNDIVVNCGCCGDEGKGGAVTSSFPQPAQSQKK